MKPPRHPRPADYYSVFHKRSILCSSCYIQVTRLLVSPYLLQRKYQLFFFSLSFLLLPSPFFFFFCRVVAQGWESANAVCCYHKLCSQVSHIWRNQHIQSEMDKPCPGKTTLLTGKYPPPSFFFPDEIIPTELTEKL